MQETKIPESKATPGESVRIATACHRPSGPDVSVNMPTELVESATRKSHEGRLVPGFASLDALRRSVGVRDVWRGLARALGVGGLAVLEQRTAARAGDAEPVRFEFLHDAQAHGIVLSLRPRLDLEVLAALALTPILVCHDAPRRREVM